VEAISAREKAGLMPAFAFASPPRGKLPPVEMPFGINWGVGSTRDPLLTVEFAKTLPDLQHLTWLRLHEGGVTDEALKEVARVRSLRTLVLHQTSRVTDAGIKELGNLPELSALILHRVKLTDQGMKGLAPLRKLTHLNLGDRPALAALRAYYQQVNTGFSGKARDDYVLNNHLKVGETWERMRLEVTDAGLKELAGMKDLATLDLSNTQITDAGLKELAGLPNLTRLSLGSTRITGTGLKDLAALKNLTTLELDNTEIGDEALNALAALPGLRSLSLGETKVTDAGLKALARLPHLESLDLTRTAITDEGLKHLRGLHRLSALGLWGTPATPLGRARLSYALPNCREVP
jgi:hypothetical protein